MNILFLIGLIILFLYLVTPKDTNPQFNSLNQQDIQDTTYVNETQYGKDYPYPQISRTFKQLSKGKLPSPLNNLSTILPSGDNELTITRQLQTPETIGTQRLYLPDYYRKDRLSQNPTGTEELRPFTTDINFSEQSWTDINVSEHPKFYNATSKDELTNIGAFFDKNNQYNDKNSSSTTPLSTDSCYTDTKGNYFCEDNTRLQLIPPQLISDPQSCYALNTVGVYKDGNLKDDVNDRVMNGGIFYNGVNASHKQNENWSEPITNQSIDCSL